MAGTFGERLAALLKERGWTQQMLAQKAGVTEAAVSHYIKGDRVPRACVLARIAEALDTTSDYLISGTARDDENEVEHAARLIARNVKQMTKQEKMEIMSILLGED